MGKALVLVFILFSVVPQVHADGDDLDDYKWRGTAFWWFSRPSGFFDGKANSGSFDLRRDFGFGDYSTFTGNIDWRFKRKHHFIFGTSPVKSSRTVTLSRTISFQGETYNVGTQSTADIKSFAFVPGYQYDIIRRNHGYLALATQLNLLNTKATLSGTVTINGQNAMRSSSGSVLAPLPIIGPRVRWYPLQNSNRLAFDGFLQGMYLFGYGDFWSGRGTVNIGLSHRWKLTTGYQLGTRLSIHGSNDRIGIRLTQKGPVAGLEASW